MQEKKINVGKTQIASFQIFRYSEGATKFEKFSHFYDVMIGEIFFSNLVAFSEYLSFMPLEMKMSNIKIKNTFNVGLQVLQCHVSGIFVRLNPAHFK